MKATLKGPFTDIISGHDLAGALVAGDDIQIIEYCPGCNDPSCCETQVWFSFNDGMEAMGWIYAHMLTVGKGTLTDIIRGKQQ